MVTRSEKGEAERCLASAKLAVLEEISHKRCFMDRVRTRGRRPERMAAAYPELQAPIKVYVYRAKSG